MSIFASIDPKVGAQYALLEKFLRPELEPEQKIEDTAQEYASAVLKGLVGHDRLPCAGSQLDRTRASELLERFFNALKLPPAGATDGGPRGMTAGDVAFNFSCLVYYAATRKSMRH